MSRRYPVRRYVGRVKRNAERHVRAGTSNVAANTQQIAYTYVAAKRSTMRGQCLTPTVIASRNTDLVSSWIIPISWGRD